jgi:hypothetical protein
MSIYFREKTRKTGAILDNVDDQLIELYPAGYTKPSKQDGANRQKVHELLFKAAQELGTDGQLFPFDACYHNVILVPEPENQYDPHAVRVVLQSHGGRLSIAHGKDLGYVPKKISRQIAQNIGLFTEGRVLKVRENFHDKYYTTKVMLGYGNHQFISRTERSLERFIGLLEE